MDYATIVSTALSLADRYDTVTSALVTNLLPLVEARINRKTLTDSITSVTTYTTSLVTDTYTLPSTYSALSQVELLNTFDGVAYASMSYLAPGAFDARRSNGDNGGYYYTILQDNLIIYPPQDGVTLRVYYFDSLVPLTSTNTTNYLSLNYPDVYVSGLMVELSAYAKDYEAAGYWENRFNQACQEWQRQDELGRWSGQDLTPKVM